MLAVFNVPHGDLVLTYVHLHLDLAHTDRVAIVFAGEQCLVGLWVYCWYLAGERNLRIVKSVL